MAYQKHDQKNCCFGSLASDLKAPDQLADSNATKTRISSSLTGEIFDIVMFSNEIMTYKARKKGDQHLCYKLEHWKKIGTFDIMDSIN